MLSKEIKLYLLLFLACKCHFDEHGARTGMDGCKKKGYRPSITHLLSENSVYPVDNIERKLFYSQYCRN